jgi:exonuclease III
MCSVGADVVALCECAVPSPAMCNAAQQGFFDGGWTTLIHSVRVDDRSRAVGVVLAIRRSYAGAWQSPAREKHGRGIAGNFTSAEGIVVRSVGVCGPTGGSLPGAASDTKWLEQERSVISFLAEQREAAEKHGWLLVALGDMNSVADIKQDTWGSTHTVRTECLAMALQDGGMTDTFRCAHPDARAFTYFHETASASRLDQVWYWAPLSVEVLICTAAVIWGWARKADHDPAVADLSMSLPDAEVEEVPVARQWHKIVRLTDEGRGDELCQQVHAAVAKRSTSMEAVGARLSQVRSELRLAKLEKAAAGACLPGYVTHGSHRQIRARQR